MATEIKRNKPVSLTPHSNRITRPFGTYFHPTRASFASSPAEEGLQRMESPRWSSRASRKSRYRQTTIPFSHNSPSSSEEQDSDAPDGHVTLSQRVKHPHSQLKPHLRWDVSLWVAIAFVLGSAAWICNGHLLYTPLSPTPSPMHANAAAWLAFVGGSLFEVGAYLAYVEALNAGHEQMFTELRRAAALKKSSKDSVVNGNDSNDILMRKEGETSHKFRWLGLGSPRDIGYLAALIQLFGASIFWISTVTGLPNVIPSLTEAWPPHPITIIFFWTPQVIGGTGFIVASVLMMLEEQDKWWKVELLRIGWHVGFWNLVGALGFTLCGALGYASTASTKVNYQSVLCTFWGSWAFMIGSVAQLWEAIWREPEDTDKGQS